MEILIFGKWPSTIEIHDPGLRDYISLNAKLSLFTQGKHIKKSFGKAKLHIVERMINNLMRGGTGKKISGRVIRGRGGCGKKTKMYNIAKKAFEIINQKTGKNPIEILVRAIENSAPREETTGVKYGGIVYRQAVDVSPQRRVDFALRNIGRASAIRSFDNPKSAAEALAEELILASNNDPQSHAVARKIEIERIARSSR
jgi:small subunit ribosomal protein S7